MIGAQPQGPVAERAFDEMGRADQLLSRITRSFSEWLDDDIDRNCSSASVARRRFCSAGSASPSRSTPRAAIPSVSFRSTSSRACSSAAEWQHLSRGLEQRVRALNAFLADIYHARDILRAGKLPSELILLNDSFHAEMQDFDPPRGAYTHVAGIDIVRVGPGDFFVLEDNCRTPSGVSYMLENREAMMRLFPDLYARHRIAPVSNYPEELHETLKSVAPANCERDPVIAVLTPGPFNSAYYEHSFLADEMGVELVEGVDLVVVDAIVYMRTTQGLKRVDVLYRRVDDGFVDPLTFRPEFDGRLPRPVQRLPRRQRDPGERGRRRHRRRQGGLSLRAGDDPLLSRRGADPAQRADLFLRRGRRPRLCARPSRRARRQGDARLGRLWHAGRARNATREEIAAFASKLRARPGDYVAQPTLALSTCPTCVGAGIAPRHVDFRPFVLAGREIRIVPGGLTRVALRQGSLVVNSSQGGGTKDTWVLED